MRIRRRHHVQRTWYNIDRYYTRADSHSTKGTTLKMRRIIFLYIRRTWYNNHYK